MSKIIKGIIISLSILTLVSCSSINQLLKKNASPNDKDIRIIFTNDIHCGFRDNLGVAKLKKYYDDIEDYKILVDAGDFSQGDSLGTINNGILTYEFMSKLGYDFVVPGNHEYDRKIPSLLSSSVELTGKMFCCNFYDTKKKQLVFDPYKIFKLGNKNVALIGVLSPDTIRCTSYTYFQDENKEYAYSFMQENGLDGLVANIQKYIDEVKNEGADYVILVMHMGDIITSVDYRSEDIVSHVNGIDAVIDGHSHNIYNILVKDKDGKEIPLAQTGTKMQSIGDMTISRDGKIKIDLIESVESTDEKADAIVNDIYAKVDEILSEVIKKDVPFALTTRDLATNERIIRNAETNLGDLCADAIRDIANSDVAISNGGGIRSNIEEGNITLDDVYKVFPFSNTLSTVKVSGKTLRDILEFGTYVWPEENGNFFQVSGITFTLDATKKSNVVTDNDAVFQYVDGEYRVKDIYVNGEPLDDNKDYTLTAINYYTENYGGGCKMFDGLETVKNNICFDADALTDYIKKTDLSSYENPYGQGRINIIVE